MAIGKFTPNNKGKFETNASGKRVFPPSWYAAQAARRKKKEDGTYKEGQFKKSIKAPDKQMLPGAKTKREMPESWHKKQAEKAAARKEAQQKGEYTRKVRGKAREYKEKDIAASLKKDTFRKIETDTYESASYAVVNLRKGHRAEIKNPKGSGRIEVTILGDGFYPATRRGVSKDGNLYTVSTSNIEASWVL